MAAGAGGLGKILGLGFLFGAKDTGVERVTGKISEGLDRVGSAVTRVGKNTAGLVRFSNAIGVIQSLQLGRVISSLESLGEKAGVGIGGQANQIESFGATFSQTFKQARAGMGEFGKELDKQKGKISGTAFNLGVGAEELTKAVADITKTGSKLGDFGLDVRALGGAIQADILGAELPNVLTSLAHGYDLGAKGAAQLLDKQTSLGEAFGVGADAAKAMPDILKAADPILAKFTNLKIDNVTDSLTRLAIASQKTIGGTFQENMESAIGVFTKLGESREQMAGLITGIGSDFPEVAKELSIASGDVGASMDMIMSDPLSFAKSVQKLMSTMDKSDPRFLRMNLMLSQFGEGFQFVVQGGDKAAKALEAASVPVKGLEGAFGKMVKGASGSTRTFAENMDLIKDSFENGLKHMTSQTDREVVKRQRAAYKALSKTIDELRKQGGVKGTLTQALLDINRHGLVHGLLPTLEKMAKGDGPVGSFSKKLKEWIPLLEGTGDGFVKFATTMGPMLIAMGQLGSLASGLLGAAAPFVLLGAGAWFVASNWEAIGPKVDDASWAFSRFSAGLVDKMKKVDWAAMGTDLANGLVTLFSGLSGEKAAGPIGRFATGLRYIITEAFVPAVKGIASGFWTALSKELGTGGASAAVLGLALMTPLRGAIMAAGSGLARGGLSLFSGLGKSACNDKSIVSGANCALTKAGSTVAGGGVLAKVGKKISGAFGKAIGSGKRLAGAITKPGIMKKAGQGVVSMLGKAKGIAAKAGSAGIKAVGTGARTVGTGIKAAGTGIKAVGALGGKVAKVLGKGVLTKIPGIGALIGAAFEIPAAAEDIAKGNIAKGTTRILAGVADGLLLGIPSLVGTAFGVDIIKETSDMAASGYQIIGQESAAAWDGIKEKSASAWAGIKSDAGEAWEGVKLFSSDASTWTQDKLTVMKDFGVAAFGGIRAAVGSLSAKWEPLKDSLVAGIKYVGVLIKNNVLTAFEKVGNIFGSIFDNWELGLLRMQDFFLSAASKITGGIKTLVSGLPAGMVQAAGLGSLGAADASIESKRSEIAGKIRAMEATRKVGSNQAAQIAASRAKEESEAKAALDKAVSRVTSTAKSKEADTRAIAAAIMISGFDRAALSQLQSVMLDVGTRLPTRKPGPKPTNNGGD